MDNASVSLKSSDSAMTLAGLSVHPNNAYSELLQQFPELLHHVLTLLSTNMVWSITSSHMDHLSMHVLVA